MDKYVITAAGGNATAIGVIDKPRDRSWYESEGSKLLEEFEHLDVEQSGFVVLSQNHFEMSGGELCGNGSRAAGLVFSKLNGNSKNYRFTTSGHEGSILVEINYSEADQPHVTGVFPNLQAEISDVSVPGYKDATLVDLGGIVHVVIYGKIPEGEEFYETEHKRVTEHLGLSQRAAVGVDWISKDTDSISMDPVVWVNSIDTYYYESSCGSGSISVALTSGINNVRQPSGEIIVVDDRDGAMTIASPMEVVHER